MALVKKRSTLKIWGDVIFAIFLREIRSQFSDRLGIAWSVISPVIFLFMLSYGRERMNGGDTHTIPTFFFMFYGMLFVQFFLELITKVSGAIQKNKQLYAFRQVQPISSIIAVATFVLLARIFVVIVIAIICYFLGMEVNIDDPLSVILNFFKVWLFASSIAILIALGICYVPEIKKIQSLAMRPMFFLSGIFFSLQDIPRQYWHYLDWNPLLHAVELTRYAAYSSYGNAGVSNLYLDFCTLSSVFLALACYHISWKQAISR